MNAPSPNQVRASMSLLGWRQKQLAAELGKTSRGAVSGYLLGKGKSANPVFGARIQSALEAQGVEFIPGGVRVRSAP